MRLWTVSGALLAVGVILLLHVGHGQVLNGTENVIQTTGTGVVTIPANIAQVQLGVQADSTNASQAQAQAAQAAQGIVSALQSLNVSRLQTSGITLTPLSFPTPTPLPFINNPAGTTGVTFRASNTVSFEVPADQAGQAIDAAVAAGANNILSVSLTASDANVSLAQQEASRQAVSNGISSAQLILNDLGCDVVGLGAVNLSPGFAPQPLASMARQGASATTPVLGGEVDITATVVVNLIHNCPSAAISALNNSTSSA